jgi:hypothetical protein
MNENDEELQPATVASVLIAWAQHEALGRLSFADDVPADLRAQLQHPKLRDKIAHGTDVGVRVALDLLVQVRRPMLAMLFAAEPIAVVDVHVGQQDAARIGWLEHRDFAATAADDFARELAESHEPLRGRIIAVASDPNGRIQVIDGLHRGRAWIERWRLRRESEPLPISVIVTARQSWWEDPS